MMRRYVCIGNGVTPDYCDSAVQKRANLEDGGGLKPRESQLDDDEEDLEVLDISFIHLHNMMTCSRSVPSLPTQLSD